MLYWVTDEVYACSLLSANEYIISVSSLELDFFLVCAVRFQIVFFFFLQSHIEMPNGPVVAPTVPPAVYQDAEATKIMAARLNRLLKKDKKTNVDMQVKVNRLRDFIAKSTKKVIGNAKKEDTDLSKRESSLQSY